MLGRVERYCFGEVQCTGVGVGKMGDLGGKIGNGPTWLFDIDTLTNTMNYQPVTACNQSNPSAGVQDKFDAEKAEEESIQQYVLFPVWSSGSTNPQNTDGDVAFDEKEPEFEGRKPESEVNISPSSSAYTNTSSAVGPSNAFASPTHGKYSCIDTSQLLDDPNMPELEDVTYSDDEDDVGAEADFNNLETSITVSPIPTTRVHKYHHVTQIIGDLSSATQTRSMTRVARDQGGLSQINNDDFHTSNYLLENGFQRGKIDQTLFIKRQKGDILLIQIYVDDIIFGSTNKDLCKAFEKLMKNKFQMSSMGELTFFLGLQVKQKQDGIFINQDKYVAEILRKFGLTDGKSASSPIDTKKPLLKDHDDEDVDVYIYRSMIGSLMYLTSSRPDIMFAVYACARFQVTPKASHLHAEKRIIRYLKLLCTSAMDSESTAGLWVVQSGMESLKRMLHVTNILSAGSLTSQQMVLNSPCLTHIKNWLVQIKWSLNWLVQKQTAPGVNTARCDEDRLELIELTVFLLPSSKVSAVSEGFNQIIDFLNGSSIKYTLTVNLNIYVSCIKQFWTSVAVKKVDCLPNEEIFTELARMGYEKPSTKLTFYKAFFLSQWKFLIHTILQCMSAKRTSWNEFSSLMASAVICLSIGRKSIFSKYIFNSLVRNVDSPTKFYMYLCFLQLMISKQVGDLSSYTTKYTSPALTQKVFANMRRVGKGFSKVDTPLFEGMLVAQEVGKDADEVHVENVNVVGVAAEGVVSAANDVVPTADNEPSIPSPTPPTTPPQLSQDIPSTSQEGIIANINVDEDVVLEDAKDVAVKKSADVDNADIQGRKAESQAKIYKIDLEHAKKVLSMHEEESEPGELQEVVDVVTTAKIITEVVTAASDIITAASTTITAASITITSADVLIPAATTAAAPTLTAAPSRRRKGVVIRDPEETTTTSTIVHSEDKSKNKVIDHVKRKQKEDNAVKRYQALKRKQQTEAQARKNMMIYLRNVAGFKMYYFKGMTYDDICPIFEKHFDSNVAFLQKTKEHMDEEDNRALKRLNESQEEKADKKQKLDEEVKELKIHLRIVPNDEDDVYTEATPLARKVPIVDYEIYNENNKPYYKNKRADGSHQLYLSFLSFLRNFDKEDLEALWSLVKERFATTKPKKFSDDFLLIILGAMFEKPDIHAQIWKNQRSVHG
uniref:Uncharacterized mitochondrial protein AtMg00810-like n=1 Tax=Tanacetum cinerariifolium TaxID=118510 RepID=A0A6L2MEB4_TANCI|nr:uncharacterized mitochondrial protein AtMg00810-like [Tanacetum cinerariifolium]